MTAARDQADRLKDGDLPSDPEADARPMEPNTETRKTVAKLLPSTGEASDAQAEASLLATLLWSGAYAPEMVPITSVLDLVPTSDVFFVRQHAAIYDAMLKLSEEAKPLDVVTVHSELVRVRKERAAAGIDFLEKLVALADSCSQAKARAYAQAVRDAWLRRRTAAVARDILASCASGKTDAGETVANAIEVLRPIGEAVASDAGVTSLSASVRRVYESIRVGAPPDFLATGIRDLDRVIAGLFPRETSIVAARTSVGKTAFATQIARNIVTQRPNVAALYVTLEMPADSFTRRLMASAAGVDGGHIRRGVVNPFDLAKLTSASGDLSKLAIFFAQSQSQTLMSVHAMATRLSRAIAMDGKRLGVIFIDHIGLLRSSHKTEDRKRHEQVAESSRGLRFLAEQHGCHVVALCQIKREAEHRKGADKMPKLFDLKESGAIEDDADNVIIVHRERDERGMFLDEPAWVAVAKSRNDELGLFKLNFEKRFARFSNWEEEARA